MSRIQEKRPRLYDKKYLSFLRGYGCLICGLRPCEAAHLRMSSSNDDKINPGIGAKPNDRDALPLCANHHRIGPKSQHAMNERDFWELHGIDPIRMAEHLYWNEYKGSGGEPRAKRPVKTRKPRGQRQKIKGRNSFQKRRD